jgi:A/G-specific adenine glycosylase
MRQLNDWFIENQRDFPWRSDRTPYRVWISEVMLQQTRASVVVPYFLKWMDLFPNIEALASAPLEKVIKVWEGLGYYSRARNLHRGAQTICSRFNGVIPSSKEELLSVPGLGPYTAAAILSFSFKKRLIAMDGNVMRVLSRYFLVEKNICKVATKRELESQGETLIDLEMPWVSAEALIELGATICTPKPRCNLCPLVTNCLGFKENKQEGLPLKNESIPIQQLSRVVVLIECDGALLVTKGVRGRIMADLYEFPFFEQKSHSSPLEYVEKMVGIIPVMQGSFRMVSHYFTRYKAILYPVYVTISKRVSVVGWEWIEKEKLSDLPFSSGHKKILTQLLGEK